MKPRGRRFCAKHKRQAPSRNAKGVLYCPKCTAIHIASMPRPGRPLTVTPKTKNQFGQPLCVCGVCEACIQRKLSTEATRRSRIKKDPLTHQTWEEFLAERQYRGVRI